MVYRLASYSEVAGAKIRYRITREQLKGRTGVETVVIDKVVYNLVKDLLADDPDLAWKVIKEQRFGETVANKLLKGGE